MSTDIIEQHKTSPRILHIAVPTPLDGGFDYLITKPQAATLLPGMRVRIPFGHTDKTGILLEAREHSEIDIKRLRSIHRVLDSTPCLPEDLLMLGHWTSQYYHYPLGEVLHHMLPTLLRGDHPQAPSSEDIWQLTDMATQDSSDSLKRAPKQAAILALLRNNPDGLTSEQISGHFSHWHSPVKALCDKGLVTKQSQTTTVTIRGSISQDKPVLTEEQAHAIAQISAERHHYKTWLLDGVTGSGKTEVYLQLIEQALQSQQQVLLLVPEIGLTPQLLERFRQRLACEMVVLHSGLSDKQRLNAWLSAKAGQANLIIGTRSAVFTPLPTPGLIIIDEEHDGSFKQQDSLRYHARDLAIMRAKQLDIPIILGSATPSLESLQNARQARYGWLRLSKRAGNAKLPRLAVIDSRQTPPGQIISPTLAERMQTHLSQGQQVLIFLNRRGYSPVLMCYDCGWASKCHRCDAHMTVHKQQNILRCHHCGSERALPQQCPDCQSSKLQAVGKGTERLEQELQQRFPDYNIIRIDKDATRKQGALAESLEKIKSGQADILIGTQMLAKGHHFPNVTLVGILGVDQGLFSADFRGPEFMAQTITQVAGRAGRAEQAGEVILETHQPDHPLLHCLIKQGYPQFAQTALVERQAAHLPPFKHLALLRAEATSSNTALDFLQHLRDSLPQQPTAVMLLGPIPAPMEKRAGRFRAQLLLESPQRGPLQTLLNELKVAAKALPLSRKVRWSIDVDPNDML